MCSWSRCRPDRSVVFIPALSTDCPNAVVGTPLSSYSHRHILFSSCHLRHICADASCQYLQPPVISNGGTRHLHNESRESTPDGSYGIVSLVPSYLKRPIFLPLCKIHIMSLSFILTMVVFAIVLPPHCVQTGNTVGAVSIITIFVTFDKEKTPAALLHREFSISTAASSLLRTVGTIVILNA